jgi:hypothetical protein
MKIKVLFLDDIFSDLFRDKVDPEQKRCLLVRRGEC